jgi:hypothetical protein
MAEYKLGRIKPVYQGTWATGTAYVVDDIVTVGGKTYICVISNTASSAFATDLNANPTLWNLIADGSQWRGTWLNSIAYNLGDLSLYGGVIYQCTTGHTSANATASITATGITVNSGTATITYAAQIIQPFLVGSTITLAGFSPTSTSTVVNTVNTTFTVVSCTTTQVTFALTGTYTPSTLGTVSGPSQLGLENSQYNAVTISAIGANGTFTCSATTLNVGTAMVISGTNSGTGTINGTASGTGTYYIIATNGLGTGFTLSATQNGPAISTTAGTPSGLTVVIEYWVPYSSNINWIGAWTVNTRYKLNDLVSYGGYTYVCSAGHVSANTTTLGLENDSIKWAVFNAGVYYQGAWSASTVRYRVNDVVTYGADLWICTTAHTSSASFATSNFSLLVSGFEYMNSWSNSASYVVGDVVSYGGYTYTALQNNSAQTPTTSPSAWQPFTTGLTFAGQWSASPSGIQAGQTGYRIGDVVTVDGYTYLAIADNAVQTLTATATTNSVATMTSTTISSVGALNIGGSVTGTVTIGMFLSGGGLTANTYYITGGSGSNWTTNYTGTAVASATITGTLNTISVSSTANLVVGLPITFGTALGGLLTTQQYYVLTIPTVGLFTVTTTLGGVIQTVSTASGSSVATTNPKPPFATYWAQLNSGIKWTPGYNTYTGLSASNITGSGSGAQFTVLARNTTYTVTVTNGGTNYASTNTAKILGTSLGGLSPANDLTITINTVSGGVIQAGGVSVSGISVTWVTGTPYVLGDTVLWGVSTYICVLAHTSASGNRPDADTTGTYWNLLASGTEQSVLTTQGDIFYYGANGPTRLPIGTDGQILRVNTNTPAWQYYGQINNAVFVSTTGVDVTTNGQGTTIDKPWASIRYACQQVEDGYLNPNTKFLLTASKEFMMKEVNNYIYYQYSVNVTGTSGTTITVGGSSTVAQVTTANLYVGMPIVFSSSQGSIVAGTTYFVATIPSSTTFTVATSYANALVPTLFSVGTGSANVGTYSYSQSKTERDAGLIIQGLIFDITHNGTYQTTTNVQAYFTSTGATFISGVYAYDTTAFNSGLNYLANTLIPSVLANTAPSTNYQLVLNPAITTTGASASGGTATITYSGSAFTVGSFVTVAGVTPLAYNGTWQVTASSSGSVSFLSSATGSQTVAGTVQTEKAKQQINATYTVESSAQSKAQTLVGYLTSCLAAGTTNNILPAVINPATTINIKTGTYNEILPINVPAYTALVGDELRSTVVQPFSADVTLATVVPKAVVALNRIKSLIPNLMSNTTITPSTGNTTAQVTSLPAASTGSTTAITNLQASFNIVYQLVSNGLGGEPAIVMPQPTGYSAATITNTAYATTTGSNSTGTTTGYALAFAQIRQNYNFLITETLVYLIANPGTSGFTGQAGQYNLGVRDLTYVLDSVLYDLTYGGNTQSLLAGAAYYSLNILQITSAQSAAYQTALGRLKSAIITVAQGSAWSAYSGNNVVQVITGGTGSAAAGNFAADRIQNVINWIANGTADSTVAPYIGAQSVALQTAYNAVVAQNSNIASDAQYWVYKYYQSVTYKNSALINRDAGLIATYTAYDMLFGSNFNAIQIGRAFNRANTSASNLRSSASGQLAPTLSAINFMYYKMKQIAASGAVVQIQTTIDDLTSYLQGGPAAPPQIIWPQPALATVATNTIVAGGTTYTSVSGTTLSGGGSSAVFTIIRGYNGNGYYNYTITPTTPGSSYTTSSLIKILGTSIGGATPVNDIIIRVTQVNAGAIQYATYSDTSAAAGMLESNRAFLLAESVAYFNANYSSLLTNPNYSLAKANRDMGYILDGIHYDLVYGGNWASSNAGMAYYSALYGTQISSGFGAAFAATINYVSTLAQQVVVNTAVASPLQATSPQVLQVGAGLIGASTHAATLAQLFVTVTAIVTNGLTTGVPTATIVTISGTNTFTTGTTANTITNTNATAVTLNTSSSYIQGTPITTGASVTTSSGLAINTTYYVAATTTASTTVTLATTLANALAGTAFNFINGSTVISNGAVTVGSANHGLSAGDIVIPQTNSNGLTSTIIGSQTSYYVISTGLTTTQFQLSTSYNGSAISTFTNGTGLTLAVQTINMPQLNTASTTALAAWTAVSASVATYQTSVVNYINTNYTAFVYLTAYTQRDVFNVTLAMFLDTLLGSNFATVQAGRAYNRSQDYKLQGYELTVTTAALNYLQTLVAGTLSSTTYTTQLTTATNNINAIISYFTSTQYAQPQMNGTITYNNNLGIIEGAEILRANIPFLQNEVTAYYAATYTYNISSTSASGNTITTSSAHSLVVNDPIQFAPSTVTIPALAVTTTTLATAQYGTLTNVANGAFTISTPQAANTFFVGQVITITGTLSGITWTGYTTGNSYVISVTNGTSSFTLTTLSGGALSTNGSNTTVTGLSLVIQTVTVASGTGLTIGGTISVANNLGNMVAGTSYYVIGSALNAGTGVYYLSISATVNGNAFAVGTASATVTLTYTGFILGGVSANTTYYVASVPSTTTFTVTTSEGFTNINTGTVGTPVPISNQTVVAMTVAYYAPTALTQTDIGYYLNAIIYDLQYTGNYRSLRYAQVLLNSINGSAGSNMWLVRNASGIRNMTMTGLTGYLGNASVVFGTKRPTGGSYSSLDPGFGPNDSNAWIYSRSCYVQNCTMFGYAAYGAKVDGALHSGGYHSMVANDYTCIIGDGIGWMTTGAGSLSELVSVFNYYSYAGYMADLGGRIRATNGNSSYGVYGVVAEGVDTTEVALFANLNNRANPASITNVVTDGVGQVYRFEYLNAGTNYTSALPGISGSGYNSAVFQDEFRDAALFETRLIDANDSKGVGGSSYVTTTNVAQGGTVGNITIAATDTALSNAYNGDRIQLTVGTGVGQYANILSYTNGSKTALIIKDSLAPFVVTATTTATATLSTSSIAVTTGILTVGTVSGTIAVGMFLTGGTIAAGVYITANISGSGAGSTWQTNTTVAQSSTTITGTQNTLTVSSTANMYNGMPIYFGTAIAGLSALNLYYVQGVYATGFSLASDATITASNANLVAVTTTTTSTISATATSTVNNLITATNTLTAGQTVSFASAYNGFDAGTTYFVNATNLTTSSFAISTTPFSGTTVTITTTGSITSTTVTIGTAVYAAGWDHILPGFVTATFGNPSTTLTYTNTLDLTSAYIIEPRISYSAPGYLGTARIIASNAYSNITYGNGRFVAIPTTGTATAYSTNGTTWNTGGVLPSSQSWTNVVYGGGERATATAILGGFGGAGAVLTAVVGTGTSATQIVSVTIVNGGYNYTTPPSIVFVSSSGSGATATCTVLNGVITSVTMTINGSGYSAPPTVTVVTNIVTGAIMNTWGKNFYTAPTITFSQPQGLSPSAFALNTSVTLNAYIQTAAGRIYQVSQAGTTDVSTTPTFDYTTASGYTNISNGSAKLTYIATQASATPSYSNGSVTSLAISVAGYGYTSVPTITITDSSALYLAMSTASSGNTYFAYNLVISNNLGSAWTVLGNGVGNAYISTLNLYGLAYGNGVYVAVGGVSGSATCVSAATPILATNWINRTITALSTGYYSAVTYGAGGSASGTFVAINYNGNVTSTSINGNTWTAGGTLPSTTTWTSVAYGNNRFVALAATGAVAYSVNYGANWYASPACAGTIVSVLSSTYTWTQVRYAQGVFFAIAQGNVAATSPDGITWTVRAMPSSTNWSGIAFGNPSNLSSNYIGAQPLWAAVSSTSGTAAGSIRTGAQPLGRMKVASNAITEIRVIEPGSNFSKGNVSATTASTNVFTVDDTTGLSTSLANNQPIEFSVASGGVSLNTTYYVIGSSVVANTSFQVTATIGSTVAVTLTTTVPIGMIYTVGPVVTQIDPNKVNTAPTRVRTSDGVLANPSFQNRGLNNSTATANTSGDGYADLYQNSSYINVNSLSAIPTAGANVQFAAITGSNQWYKLVTVSNITGISGNYSATFQINPALSTLLAPANGNLITTRLKYSQVRLTGHDFLYIGTGNQTQTNYPNVIPGNAIQANQSYATGGGRVFFTSTDQDGNFNVGNLFGVQQSTGTATLNASAFALSGLQSLTLGNLSVGVGSATITSFSTDPYFTANSDNVVPTQKAIKSYITAQIGGGSSSLNVNTITSGQIYIANNTISNTTGNQILVTSKMTFTSVDGAPVSLVFFGQR